MPKAASCLNGSPCAVGRHCILNQSPLCPGEDEYRFKIENHEEHGNEVEFRREAEGRVTDGNGPGLERMNCCFTRMSLSQNGGNSNHRDHQENDSGEIHDQRP
jgi:hypothetical protein